MGFRIARLPALVAIAVAAVVVMPAAAGAAPANPNGTVVTGRVVDTAGNPLAGVRVSFETSPLDDGPELQFVTTTAADGTYRAVRRGADVDPASVYLDGRNATGPSSTAGYLTGHLLDATGNEVEVSATPGVRVAGRDVVLAPGAGVAGRVTTAAGVPLAHVQVELLGDATWTYGPGEPITDTDSLGRWSMRALDLGRHAALRVTFDFSSYAATGGDSPTGYPYACLGLVPDPCESDGPSPSPATVRLVPGRVASGADIALPDAAQLRGRVTDAAGVGIGGAVVYAFNTERQGSDGQPREAGGMATDAQGHWTYGALLPGTYAVCTGRAATDVIAGPRRGPRAPWGYAPSCSPNNAPITGGVYAGALYTLPAGEDLAVPDFVAATNGAVKVDVVDEHGAAVPDATVQVGMVGPDGTFTLVREATPVNGRVTDVAPGRDSVCASAPGFVSTCPPVAGGPTVTVHPSAVATARDIVLTPAPS